MCGIWFMTAGGTLKLALRLTGCAAEDTAAADMGSAAGTAPRPLGAPLLLPPLTAGPAATCDLHSARLSCCSAWVMDG